ncbi:MAG: RNA polymerase sigma factor [Sedimentisphaerales bacterium]|nr:RNA polymerase sigma factor [Sedimentisphaerales bacterium]
MEDKLLILRCRQGSRDALRQIYEKYRDHLLILAIALLNDNSSAEDVLHDVFVRFVEDLPGFRLTGSLKGYLSTCVANRARNRIRSRKMNPVNLDTNDPIPSKSSSPLRTVVCSEELVLLSRALAQLPEDQREVIVLHMHGDMRFKEIARTENIPVNTVKSRYRYGMDKLRVLLNGQVKK